MKSRKVEFGQRSAGVALKAFRTFPDHQVIFSDHVNTILNLKRNISSNYCLAKAHRSQIFCDTNLHLIANRMETWKFDVFKHISFRYQHTPSNYFLLAPLHFLIPNHNFLVLPQRSSSKNRLKRKLEKVEVGRCLRSTLRFFLPS